jgi:hypothetical protein
VGGSARALGESALVKVDNVSNGKISIFDLNYNCKFAIF